MKNKKAVRESKRFKAQRERRKRETLKLKPVTREEALTALEALSGMVTLTDYAFTAENVNAVAILKRAKVS